MTRGWLLYQYLQTSSADRLDDFAVHHSRGRKMSTFDCLPVSANLIVKENKRRQQTRRIKGNRDLVK